MVSFKGNAGLFNFWVFVDLIEYIIFAYKLNAVECVL